MLRLQSDMSLDVAWLMSTSFAMASAAITQSTGSNAPRLLGPLVATFAFATCILVLFLFNPAQYGFYPQCGFHSLTGLSCPACGSLRAVHQLLHGNLREALTLNPLLVILAPFLALLVVNQVVSSMTGRLFVTFHLRRTTAWLLAAIVVLFTLARNISGVIP